MSTQTSLAYTHIYRPPERPSGRTLLLLHGTGGNERDLLPLGAALAGDRDGANLTMGLLSPLGDVRENGMARFFARLAEGIFDEDDVVYRAGRLAQFVRAAADQYRFDPDGVVAAGFSNGANIAAAVLLLHPGVLRGGMLFSPMTPLAPSHEPDLTGTPIFISAGRQDPIASPAETERLWTLLDRCGADVDLHWYPGGHRLGPESIADASAWLEEHVGA